MNGLLLFTGLSFYIILGIFALALFIIRIIKKEPIHPPSEEQDLEEE